MSFLYPSFLFAIAAVAVPIIIHLFNFRKYKTVYFSNVRFLREVKEKTDSRSQLKHLLILLCRILAIIFLVLAFAQPYMRSHSAPLASGKQGVSIFIDNSFSMGQLSSDVPLSEQARLKATQLVNAYGADDLFQLLTEDFEGRHQRLVNKDEMLNLIREVQPSPATHSVADIISRQKQALGNSGAVQKNIFIISDFQKKFYDFSPVKPDSTYHINLVPLNAQVSQNLYIDTCWMESPVQVAGQPDKLMVKIINDSRQSVENDHLTLQINDQTKAISNFSVGANAESIDTLSYTITDKGWNRAILSITDHPITFDDTYYFTYPVATDEKVMVINESLSNPYLDALFAGNAFFIQQNVSFNQLNYSDLASQQFVIVNGVKQISTGLASELKKFTDRGGNLVIFPDRKSDVASYNAFFQSMNTDVLTGFEDQKKNVSSINTSDEIFRDVFQQVPQNLSLPQSSGSFSFSQRTNTNAVPLMTCSDGSYFMTKYVFGKGLLYVSAVPLDKIYSDLPLNPVFAPMVYKMAVSKKEAALNAFVIGKNNQVSLGVDLSNAGQVLRLKGQNREFIPSQRLVNSELLITLNNEITQSGTYALQDANGAVKSYIALNYDRKESDLHFLSEDELEKLSVPLKIRVIENSSRDLAAIVSGQNLGLPLWKLSVIFVLIFIALETVLLKFWK